MPIHTIPPVWNGQSHTLILGSFPSVKSRETAFFYGHPQNRFWRVTAEIFGAPVPQSMEEKRAFLLSCGLAVWDVIASCEIVGSSDSSIRDVHPNDIAPLLAAAPITRIFTNGKTAHSLYCKYIQPDVGRAAVCLPSTSPANAAFSISDLVSAWRVIRPSPCIPQQG